MSNVQAPYGFRWVRNLSGGAPTYQVTTAYILASYATQIFKGDVVTWASGYINLATPGTTTIAGIFDGCEWQSQAMKQPRWSNYWPGSDAPSGGYVKCQIITDPFAVFQAQSNGSAITQANVDENINFASGTGNTSTGFSGQSLNQSTLATTSTLPFRVINVGGPTSVNNFIGSDNTSSYNSVEVVFNNAMLRNLTSV